MTVPPRDAATVIILRPCSESSRDGFEVLMALRNRSSAFVPGSYVFPGGRVDDADYDEKIQRFIDDGGWSALEGGREGSGDRCLSAAIRIAAIRETFEELGLLYALSQETRSLLIFDRPDDLRRFRRYGEALRAGEVTLAEILERENLTLALDRLHFFSHWVTPELMPKRYDTRFFVALAPPGQEAVHDGDEMTTHRWIAPREALEGYRRNDFHMVVPTIVTLEELCRFRTADEVIAHAGGKPIARVLTRLVIRDGEVEEHAPDGRIFRNLVPPG